MRSSLDDKSVVYQYQRVVLAATREAICVDLPLQFSHAERQLLDQIIEIHLLLAWLWLIYSILEGLSGDIVVDVLAFADEFLDVIGKVEAAKRAFCFDFEPLSATLGMEVVLWVAAEDQDFLSRLEVNQADGAVGHIEVLVLILFVTHVLQ